MPDFKITPVEGDPFTTEAQPAPDMPVYSIMPEQERSLGGSPGDDIGVQPFPMLGGGGAPPRPGPFKRLSGAEISEPGYVYHATNEERAWDIAHSGSLGVHEPSAFTDQETWPDGSTELRNYFTPSAENTWQFAPEEGHPVLLRLKAADHPIKKERGTPDLYSTKPVPADKLEFLDENGNWQPLVRPSP